MSKSYQVQWSKTAETDLIGIIKYIQQGSPQAATKVFADIKAKTADLVLFPERECVVPELQAQGIGHYRELIIAPWRIIFRCSEDVVYVLSMLDARRNVEDILLDRLIRNPS
jgi:plasmid stabilization system protein ParE